MSAPFIVVHGANAVRDAIAAKLGTPTQVVTSVSGFQLALVKQVGNSETEWQAEAGLQQGPSFEIEEDRGVGDQHVSSDSAPCESLVLKSRRFLDSPVQLVYRQAEQLRGLWLGNSLFRQQPETSGARTHRFLAFHRIGLFVRRGAPPTVGNFVEEPSKQGLTENVEVLTTIRDRLNAHTKEPL